MDNIIIGLSGHIDHGKTSFIKALNNYDGDSRADEIERGMTIDVSFSNMIIDSKQISFIDVPGHEKLVKNMISGVGGIDILALIVAADDSLMPQSIEHLQIARLLGIKRLIVFISKCDLVSKDRVESVSNEVREFVENLGFRVSGIYPFSIYDNALIEGAKDVLAKLESNKEEVSPFFRYYCDRSFSLRGLGSIVTGTILSGSIKKGDRIFICDLNKEVVIKSIHNHKKEVETASYGQRIALSLANISKDEIKKGFLLSKKGVLRKFSKIDCVIFPLKEIKNNQHVVFFIGSRRINASINIIKKYDDRIFATLNLENKIFGTFKEHFILRDNARSIGGGNILNPISDPMRKEQKLAYLESLYNDDLHSAFAILINAHNRGFGLVQSLQRFNITYNAALEIAKEIKETSGIFIDEEELVLYSLKVQDEIKDSILRLISKNKNAIFSANSINNELKWSSQSFTQSMLDLLLKENRIKKMQNNLYISLDSNIKDISSFTREKILLELESSDITPIAPYNIYDKLDIDRKFGDSIFKELTKAKRVIRLSHNVFILTTSLNKIMEHFREIIKKEGYIDIAMARKYYNISRKYLVCYLDYLDNFGDIYKDDNKRRLKNAN